MKNYAQIAAKITHSPWLITPEGLSLILSIMDARINNPEVRLTDEELAILLKENAKGSGLSNGNSSNEGPQVVNGVGILPIYGPIFGKANLMTQLSGATSMEAFRKDLKMLLADNSVKQILLDVDSPGGTSEMIAEAADEIFAGRDIKPITAIANNMIGSAAYYLASQASKLYTTPSGSVGSIGVYTVHEDHSGADKQQGIKYTFVSAAPYKTEGNPHEPLSQEGEAYRQEIVNELYDEFLTAVARGRSTDKMTVESTFGGGRLLSAKRAHKAGMVDGIYEFDPLLESLASTPTNVSLHVNGRTVANAVGLLVTDVDGTGHIELSVADYEHSEPGTGTPPTPRVQDPPPEQDLAIRSGSRRPDITRGLGSEEDEPGAPQASTITTASTDTSNKGKVKMDLQQLYQLFGVDNEEALLAAITDMHTEQTALRSGVDTASQQMEFAKQYPDVWAQMQKDREKLLANDANEFVSAVSFFTELKEGNTVKTKIGLSSLAQDTVRENYMKFAKGEGGLEEFKSTILAITQNGTLEYGERGTSAEGELPEFDTNSATGIAALRQLFASKVAEVMQADKLEYAAAVQEASKRYPDLAKAYTATASVR